jgi:hypothetical protein
MSGERTSRTRGVKKWLAFGVFGVSVLALLGTSPARWTMQESVKGPHEPPSRDHALRVRVEASEDPRLPYKTANGTAQESTCVRTGKRPTDVTCVLPPGATVDKVEMRGICGEGGGGGGCRRKSRSEQKQDQPCAPPPGAYVRASSEIVSVWKQKAELAAHVSLPPRPSGKGASLSHIEVYVEPDVPDVEVTLHHKGEQAPKSAVGTPAILTCGTYPKPPGPNTKTCSFYGFEQVSKAVELDLVAEAVRWGACPDDKPCDPPADTPLKVVAIVVKP